MGLAPNCVALWKMNELFWDGTPDEVKDNSGKGNHGVRSGVVTTDAGGKIKRCGTFNGLATNYLKFGQPVELDFAPDADDFSIFGWIKIASGKTGAILSKAKVTAGTRQYYLFVAADCLSAMIGGITVESGVTVADGTWHFVGVVNYDDAGTQKFQLYVDGAAAGAPGVSGAGTNEVDVLIGARRNNDNTDDGYQFTGLIDAVMIFNKALSDGEVLWLYDEGRGREELPTRMCCLVSGMELLSADVGQVKCARITETEYTTKWISPTGWEFPVPPIPPFWTNPDLAYDDYTTTFAYRSSSENEWTSFLILILSASILCDKIRFWAAAGGAPPSRIDVDVYDGASWHGVYEGMFFGGIWVEQSFPAKFISKARIRLKDMVLADRKVYEFDFGKVLGQLCCDVGERAKLESKVSSEVCS